ncbi:MAG: pyridoxal phosphate-dependent aminotransferase [Balneolales bacterium]|nr:pyridoxal phosphate-dependent aminotransferase [Balneolales bacterium]
MKSFANRTKGLKQSGIRAVTQMVNAYNGINLGQGICDLPTPEPIKSGAINAVNQDKSIYSYHSGISSLRSHVAQKFRSHNGISCEAEKNVMITNGSTGAFVAACLSILEPGDEVIQPEPYYGYHVQLLKLLGFTPVFVPLKQKDWRPDLAAIENAITPRTKAIVVTNPGNPAGTVWSEKELEGLLGIMKKHHIWAFTDEVYEYMTYDGHSHISLASLDSAFERTLTMTSFSKTFNMTGWRLGAAVGPEALIEKMGLINDLIYICPPTPLQYGLKEAFLMDESYYDTLSAEYDRRRTLFCDSLKKAGFSFRRPEGAYYVFASFENIHRAGVPGFENDLTACEQLIKETGIGSVPGSSFFSNPEDGRFWLRFCYAKDVAVLEDACERLESFGKKHGLTS